jgi:hypothetical protein
LRRAERRAKLAGVKMGAKAVTPDAGQAEAAAGWRELRADSDIQFSEINLPQQPPEPPPDWLAAFFEWVAEAFEPVARMLVAIWPVLQWVLAASLIGLVLVVLWRMFGPDMAARRSRAREAEEWTPGEAAALALLEEADRLAAEGRFDEATHLLLQRSVGQIAAARPDLVEPSSTARELAAAPALPAKARGAFGVIAERVERSLFALRSLTLEDWQAARAAYADFALEQRRLAL